MRVVVGVWVAAVFGLTAWVFYLTRNPWSFAILLLVQGLDVRTKG